MTSLLLALALLACDGTPEPAAPAEAPPPAAPEAPPRSERSALGVALQPAAEAKTTPFPTAASPDLEKTLEVLGAVVDYGAGDPANPWAISHGVLARGEGFLLRDGQPAVEHLFSAYANELEIDGTALVGFPRSAGDLRVEPHTDLMLKNLTEVGISPDRVVLAAGHQHEVEDLWRHSLATTWLKRDGSSSFDSPNDMPWGLQGLAAWAPADLRWTAWEGTEMSLDDMAKLLAHVLHSESVFLFEAARAGQGFQKEGQGIFKYTCGGAHLLQGAVHVVARGFGDDQARQKVEAQGPLLFYRLPLELAIYQGLMEKYPNQRMVLLAQQLKFAGHWLESAHKMAIAGMLNPDSEQQVMMAQVVDIIIATTRELKALGALDNLDQIRAQNEQLYLDLVGDSAHAIRGLELATGRGGYRI